MASGGSKGEIEKSKDKIRQNKKEIKNLKEKVKKLQERLKDHDKNYPRKIKALEQKNERLKRKIHSLEEEIKRLERKILTMKKDLKDYDRRIKDFELSKDEICIAQLCTSTEENLCEIVLKDYFQPHGDHKTSRMEEHIRNLIKDEREQKAARERWETLKGETAWNRYWITYLNTIKYKRNKKAHPNLTEKKIKKAKRNLKAKKELDNVMVKAVDKLTEIWKQTNAMLPSRQTHTEPEEHLQEIINPHQTDTSNEDQNEMIHARIGTSFELRKHKGINSFLCQPSFKKPRLQGLHLYSLRNGSKGRGWEEGRKSRKGRKEGDGPSPFLIPFPSPLSLPPG